MREYHGVEVGNILTVEQGIIAHGCNAQGVMGGGIAKDIRAKYPEAFEEYFTAYRSKGLTLGEIIFVEVKPQLYIANCITQQNYGTDDRRFVSYQAIKTCFSKLASISSQMDLAVHYPLIGAGLAHGEWSIIKGIIDDVWAREGSTPHHLWVLD